MLPSCCTALSGAITSGWHLTPLHCPFCSWSGPLFPRSKSIDQPVSVCTVFTVVVFNAGGVFRNYDNKLVTDGSAMCTYSCWREQTTVALCKSEVSKAATGEVNLSQKSCVLLPTSHASHPTSLPVLFRLTHSVQLTAERKWALRPWFFCFPYHRYRRLHKIWTLFPHP